MKVFVSSTAYDLYDFRALIEKILTELGHICIAHEEPDFPIRCNLHSHDQCIEAVKDVDLVICILDKRYGEKYAGNTPEQFEDIQLEIKGYTCCGNVKKYTKTIEKQNLSITWCELLTAKKNNIPIFTFARNKLLDEKNIRRKNQFCKCFRPVYADKEDLYDLIDWITKERVNNWIAPFDSIVDFEEYFRKWIQRIELGIYTPKNKSYSQTNVKSHPLFFIVEGETDRDFIKLVIEKTGLNIEGRFMVTYGRYRLFNHLMDYVTGIKEGESVFILYDTDNDNQELSANIQDIKNKLSKRLEVKEFAIEPNIESWIRAGVKELPNDNRKLKQFDLEQEFTIELAEQNSPSFKKFLTELKKYE